MIQLALQLLFETPDFKNLHIWLQLLLLSISRTPCSANKLNILVYNCVKTTNIVQSLLDTSVHKVDIFLL